MGVRIFLSSGGGNKEIENSQQRIQMVLTTRAIQFVTIDISAPGMQEMRSFMRDKAMKREGQRNVLPPQIFNGEEYRGDYEGFDIANEDDDLEEFLGIPRKNPKAEPVKTGAVASFVGKLNPGKLKQDEITERDEKQKIVTETTSEELPLENKDRNTQEDYALQNENCRASKNETRENHDSNEMSVNNKKATNNDDDDNNENGKNDNDNFDSEKLTYGEIHEHTVKGEALKDEADTVSENTDDFTGHIKEEVGMDNDGNFLASKDNNEIEDSSDESSDEDTAVEYMPDGELVRKKSRGFKQLSNCKRFWKASLMVE